MRLIDADALKEAMNEHTDYKGYLVCDPEEIIDLAPTVEERPHGEWISKPKRVQVDETDEERIFETKLEWFCSSCNKSFGCRKPDDAFCKYCGSDNRPKEGERNDV